MEKEDAKVAEVGQEAETGVSTQVITGAQACWVLGASIKTGLYSQRVKIHCGVWNRGGKCDE